MAGSDPNTWWSWVQSAKDKVISQSSEVLELVKKDIDEFTKVVSDETSSIVSSSTNAIKESLNLSEENSAANQMKKSVSGFINHVAEVFTLPPDDDDEEALIITNQQPIFVNRLEAAIYSMCQEPSTFLLDPDDEVAYKEWLTTFDINSYQAELSDLLVNNQYLRKQYTTLVPQKVLHLEFWHRYYYKVYCLQEAEKRRQKLKEKTRQAASNPELVWDDEEPISSTEISEDLQDKLLNDYDNECKEKKDLGKKLLDNKGLTLEENNEDEWEKVEAEESDITAKSDAKTS